MNSAASKVLLRKIIENLTDYFDITNLIYSSAKIIYTVLVNEDIVRLIKSKLRLREVIENDENDQPIVFYSVIDSTGKIHGNYTRLFPTGDSMIECNYVSGMLDGEYRLWIMPDSHCNEEKHYRLNILHGEEVLYTPDGKVTKKTHWKNGVKNGLEETFSIENYRLLEKLTYSNGVLDGDQQYLFPSGGFRELSKYVNGVAKSKVMYDNDGWVVYYIEYSTETGKKHGVYEEYYSRSELYGSNLNSRTAWTQKDGDNSFPNNYRKINSLVYPLKKHGHYYQDKMDSAWITYNKYGSPTLLEEYLNGKLHGTRTEFIEKGQITIISRKSEYQNGELHGYTTAFETESIVSITLYTSNSPSCRSKYWNNNLKSIEFYNKNRKVHGLKVHVAMDGKSISKITRYVNGMKNGLEVTYNNVKVGSSATQLSLPEPKLNNLVLSNTEITRFCQYKNGRLTGLYLNIHENGNLKLITELNDLSKPHGLYLKYHDNGEIYIVCNYAKTGIIGWYREYYQNGHPKVVGWYSQSSQLDGNYYEYWDSGQLRKKLIYAEGCLFLDIGTELVSFNENGMIKKKIIITEQGIHVTENDKTTLYIDSSLFENLTMIRPEILDF